MLLRVVHQITYETVVLALHVEPFRYAQGGFCVVACGGAYRAGRREGDHAREVAGSFGRGVSHSLAYKKP